jgi:hypothetical protein
VISPTRKKNTLKDYHPMSEIPRNSSSVMGELSLGHPKKKTIEDSGLGFRV